MNTMPLDLTERDDALSRDHHVDLIGKSMGRMRLMTARRLIARMAIKSVAPELEVSHIDALDAVLRTEDKDEVTVGTIAENMRIDPSRASRIVSDMVGRKVLRRRASQADARRIVVEVTPLGRKLLADLRKQKLAIVSEIIADWQEDEVEIFARLFERYVSGLEDVFARHAKEVEPPVK